MGVLYDLYLIAHARPWPKRMSGPVPDVVLAWAGISRDLEREVVSHNDLGYSFRDVASVIEAKLLRAERDRRWQDAERTVAQAISRAQAAPRRELEPQL
jgi:hypothetical protein